VIRPEKALEFLARMPLQLGVYSGSISPKQEEAKMQMKQPALCVSMSGPTSSVPPFELEPHLREALGRELKNAGASEEARDEALEQLSILLARFKHAPTKDSGPRTQHRDEAEAILRDLNAVVDRVTGASRRTRGRFFFQIGKRLVETDRKVAGKRRFRDDKKLYGSAGRATLKRAQSRVSPGRQPARPELSVLVSRAAFIWQKFTGQKFVATIMNYSKKPVVGAQIRFFDLLMDAADVKDLEAAAREHLMKQALKAVT